MFLVIEFVFGNLLEDRLNQLLTARPGIKKIKIISLHIFDTPIKNSTFRRKLELLVQNQVKIIIIIDRKVLSGNLREQAFVDDLVDNLGITVFPKKGIHAKIVLLEGSSNGLLVSSLNISDTALHRNKEAGIYVENDSGGLIDDARDYITSILGVS